MRLPPWPLLMPIWPPACLSRKYSFIYLHYYYDLGFSRFIWPLSADTHLLLSSLNLRQTSLCVNFHVVNEEFLLSLHSEAPMWCHAGSLRGKVNIGRPSPRNKKDQDKFDWLEPLEVLHLPLQMHFNAKELTQLFFCTSRFRRQWALWA